MKMMMMMKMMMIITISCVSSLHVLDINPVGDTWFANIFSLSVGWLLFHSDGCFFCYTETLKFDIVPDVNFSFCFWCYIKKTHCQGRCQGAFFPCVFFQEFYSFRAYIKVLNPFQVNFSEWYKIEVQFYTFVCEYLLFPELENYGKCSH